MNYPDEFDKVNFLAACNYTLAEERELCVYREPAL